MEGHHESAYQSEHNSEHHEHRTSAETKEPLPYAIPVSIIVAAVIIAGAIIMTGKSDSNMPIKKVATAGDAVESAGDFKSLEPNAPVLGNAAAPVAIVEFADFQCPFCGRFYETTAKEIIYTYVKTGKAKLIYRDFAFLGEESGWAAEASRCAGDQGKYWDYHNYLFEHQKGENQGSFAKNHLKSFALELGLNAGEFNKCLDSGKYTQAVADDTAMGKKFGVTGTPTTFVNGKLVQGAVPFTTIKPIIEDALKGK